MSKLKHALQVTNAALYRAIDGGPHDSIKVLLERLAKTLLDVETLSTNEAGTDALCQRVDRLLDILAPLTARSNKPSPTLSPVLSTRLQILSEEVSNINQRKEAIKSQTFLSRIAKSKENLVYLDHLNKILEDALEEFLVRGSISTEHMVSVVRHNVTDRLSDLRQESRVQHAELMGAIDASSSLPLPRADAHYSSSLNTATPCLDGTRVDVLQRINEWITNTNPDCPSVFWVNGAAGTGKSTIAQTIAEEMDAGAGLAASFFFSRNDSDRSDAQLFFTTIAYQLAHFRAINPTYRQRIKEVLSAKPTIGRDLLRFQFRELLVKPLKGLDTHQPLVIVVDALDECADDRSAAEILLLLSQLFLSSRSGLDVPRNVRILVSSRPAHHISTRFQTMITSSVSDHIVLHDIETAIVRDDIVRYFRFHLTEVSTQFSFGVGWPREEQVQQLADKAAGLFIFAATAVKFIRDSRDPKQQLRFLLATSAAASLSRQANLDWLYLQILHSSIRPNDGPQAVQDFKDVVGAIVLLRDTLSIAELAAFLEVSVSRVKNTLMFLHAVILVPESTQFKIRLLHPSFPEFLTQAERCNDSRFYILEESHHTRLAQLCFSHMLSALRRDMCAIGDPSKLNADVQDLDTRLRNKFPVELRYSCCSWAYHASKSGADFVKDSLKAFCQTNLLTWLEAMSLLGEIDQAITSLSLMAMWCQRSLGDDFTNRLLDDCLRLLLTFTEPIRLSASHVYHSALAFAPQCLLLATYSSELSSSVRVVLGLSIKWDSLVRSFDGDTPSSFSPDGRQVATRSGSTGIHLWDFNSGQLLDTHEHPNTVRDVAFSKDGSRVAVEVSADGTYIWNVVTGTLINRFPYPQAIREGSQGVSFSWDHALLARLMFEELEVFDVTAGRLRAQIPLSEQTQSGEPIETGYCVAFSPDISEPGYMIAVGCKRRQPTCQPTCYLMVCNTEDRKTWKLADASDNMRLPDCHEIESVQYSLDGSLLIAGMFEERKPVITRSKDITRVDGSQACSRNLVRIWDVASRQCVRRILSTFSSDPSCTRIIHVLPDGGQFATHSGLWSLEDGIRLRSFTIPNTRVRGFSPDGSVYLARQEGVVSAFRSFVAPEMKINPAVTMRKKPVLSKLLAGLSLRHAGQPRTEEPLSISERLLSQMKIPVTSVAVLGWGSSQAVLLCGLDDGAIQIWDVAGARLRSVINENTYTEGGCVTRIRSISVAPSNLYFASSQGDGWLALWDARTYACLRRTSLRSDGLTLTAGCLAFPSDWQMGMPLAVTIDHSNVPGLWDPSTGTWVTGITSDVQLVPELGYQCCTFSKDSATIFRPIPPSNVSHIRRATDAGRMGVEPEAPPKQELDLLTREADIFLDQGWLFLRRLDRTASRWNSWERACWIPPLLRPDQDMWCSNWRSGNFISWRNRQYRPPEKKGLHQVIIDVSNRLADPVE